MQMVREVDRIHVFWQGHKTDIVLESFKNMNVKPDGVSLNERQYSSVSLENKSVE